MEVLLVQFKLEAEAREAAQRDAAAVEAASDSTGPAPDSQASTAPRDFHIGDDDEIGRGGTDSAAQAEAGKFVERATAMQAASGQCAGDPASASQLIAATASALEGTRGAGVHTRAGVPLAKETAESSADADI